MGVAGFYSSASGCECMLPRVFFQFVTFSFCFCFFFVVLFEYLEIIFLLHSHARVQRKFFSQPSFLFHSVYILVSETKQTENDRMSEFLFLSPTLGKLFTSPQLSTVFSISRWRPEHPMEIYIHSPRKNPPALQATSPLVWPSRCASAQLKGLKPLSMTGSLRE